MNCGQLTKALSKMYYNPSLGMLPGVVTVIAIMDAVLTSYYDMFEINLVKRQIITY